MQNEKAGLLSFPMALLLILAALLLAVGTPFAENDTAAQRIVRTAAESTLSLLSAESEMLPAGNSPAPE